MLVGFFLSIAIVLTYSRASYLAALASVASYLALTLPSIRLLPKKAIFACLTLLAIAAGLFLVRPYAGEGTLLTRTSTISARIVNAQETLIGMSRADWLWGKGLFVFSSSQTLAEIPDHSTFPDNLVTWLILQVGLIGLICYVGLVAKLWKSWHKLPLLRSMLVAILLHSLFQASYAYTFTTIFTIWIVAVLYAQLLNQTTEN
jgi:hypothetical protein